MKLLSAVLATLVATGALAQQDLTETSQPSVATSRAMSLGNVDAWGTLSTDLFLMGVEVGAGADVGVVPLGPGTLAVGAEATYSFCFSICGLISLATDSQFGFSSFAPLARASYHLVPGGMSGVEKLDLYGVLVAGPTFDSLGMKTDQFTAEARTLGLQVGLGGGARYFVNDRVFIGGEGRFTFGQHTTRLEVTSGEYAANYVDVPQLSSPWFKLFFVAGGRF